MLFQLKKLKAQLEIAEQEYELAYAEFFTLKAPNRLASLYGINVTNAVKDKKTLEKLTISDPAIKEKMININIIKEKILNLEEKEYEEELAIKEEKLAARDFAEVALSEIAYECEGGNVWFMYLELEKQMSDILDSIEHFDQKLHRKEQEDYIDPRFLEDYWKSMLLNLNYVTKSLNLLRELPQLVNETEKEAHLVLKQLTASFKEVSKNLSEAIRYSRYKLTGSAY